MIQLRDKVVVITGAGAGIGLEIALAFASQGASVVGLEIDRERKAALEATLNEREVSSLVVSGDATSAADVAMLMAAVERRFGRIDVLVNNVGDALGIRKPFGESTEADWSDLYRVNLEHVFLVTREALPLLRRGKHGASIINISSIEAFRAAPLLSPYSAFKAAVTGFTRSLAVELGPDGIRVNAIAPETTETAQVPVSTWVPGEYRSRIKDWIPLGRFGLPGDVAGSALFLGSDLSAWMTGTTLHVDGGALAAGGYLRTPDGRWTHTPVVVDDGYGAAREGAPGDVAGR